MAHFQCGCRGDRKQATRLAGRNGLPEAFINGWNHGAKLVGRHDSSTNTDFFDVFASGGSNSTEPPIRLGYIKFTKAGPKFVKAKS